MGKSSESIVEIDLKFDPQQLPHTDAQSLLNYWRSCSKSGALPKWSDIDFLEVPEVIPNLNVQEVSYNPLQFRMSLLGRNIVDQVGEDSTGLDISSVAGTSDVLARFEKAVVERVGYFVSGLSVTWASRDYKTYATLVLPVVDEDAAVSQLLCWVGGFS